MTSNIPQKISIEELRARAESGDTEAQSVLGLFYELGLEVEKADPEEAAKWWGKAAKAGNANAQFSLAELITREFEDTEENRTITQALYKKAEAGGMIRSDKAIRMLDRDRGRPWRAMVVEDAATTRVLMRAILEAEGCDVIEAADGKEALTMLKKTLNVQIIFTDINMPRMDGFDLIKAIHLEESLSHIPIIVMTAENSAEAVMLGKKLVVMGWIVKPPRAHLVRRYLNKVIANWSSLQKKTG